MKILINESQRERLVKHLYQPNGISCGPTCIKMVGDFLRGEISSIEDICKDCGTDNITGTPPDRMRKGLDAQNIPYVEHMDEENPFDALRNVLDNGSNAILRTLTHSVPHWIVVYGYQVDENGVDVFLVNDPWLGQLTYSEDDLNSIWEARNYFYFEVPREEGESEVNEGDISEPRYFNNVQIRKYNRETDFKKIFPRLNEVYDKLGWTPDAIWEQIGPVDEELSVVVEVDGNVAGFYFIGGDQIIPGGDPDVYETLSKLNGIEGVALGVFPEYKNAGIGKMLIDYPATLGYDYIWGYQLKTLNNINDWLKRRKIYVQTAGLYVTCQIFNSNEESI